MQTHIPYLFEIKVNTDLKMEFSCFLIQNEQRPIFSRKEFGNFMEDFAEEVFRVQFGSQGLTQFHARQQFTGGQCGWVYHKVLQIIWRRIEEGRGGVKKDPPFPERALLTGDTSNVKYRTGNRRMMKCSFRHSIFLVRYSAVYPPGGFAFDLLCKSWTTPR
jgi:hypothetical protein